MCNEKDIRIDTIEKTKLYHEVEKGLKMINEYSGYGTITISVYDKRICNIKPSASKDLTK